MNKYRDKSDFEINRLIARINDGIHTNDEKTAVDCYTSSRRSPTAVLATDCDIGYLTFDFCNNPTDAMPIIIENGISSLFNGDEWICSALDGEFLSINENLYRAGCEVFLMMKDAESEKV